MSKYTVQLFGEFLFFLLMRMNVNVGGQAVKQVRSFRYLGSLVDEDGRCDAEIR